MTSFLFVLLLLASAQAEPQVYTLENGLTVVLEEMHFAPTAVVMVQYQVGARNESAEISGISHFTEHMMFNGTPDMPGSSFWQQVQMEGGRANGGTGNDHTTYFIYLPSAKLEKTIRIESDRMVNCLMDSAAIAQEIGVVTDEWRLSQDSPDRQLWYAANEAYFGDHPLSRTVLGTGETIAAFNESSVRDYYETWYRPSNAILIIAGDFETDQVRELVDHYFGTIPCDGPSPNNVPPVTALDHPERVDLDFPAEQDRFLVFFRGCSPDSPDLPALILLNSHFSGGRLGWITREMINSGILTSGYSSRPSGFDEKPFALFGAVAEGEDVEAAVQRITAEAFRLASEEMSQERLTVLQDYLTASERTSVSNPLERAYKHAFNLSLYGDIEAYDRMLGQIEELTPAQLQDVASRYFTEDGMMVTVLHAVEGGGNAPATSSAGTTETEVPEITDWSSLELPAEFSVPGGSVSQGVTEFTLENGLTLLVKEDHSFPNVEIMMTVPMGMRMEEPEHCGISAITCEMLLRGTEELPFDRFHERVAVLGSSTWMEARHSYSIANAYGLSEHAGVWFTSLSDMLRRPAMTQEDFNGIKNRHLAQLVTNQESTYYEAFNAMDEILLTPGNQRNAAVETVEAISLEDVRDWWTLCVRPKGSVIAVVGDLTPEEALALAEEHFGDWENPEEPLPPLVEYQFSQIPGDTLVVSMPGKIQVAEVISCRAPAWDSEDYAAFTVMGSILGSGIGSRLGQNVRETQGLAYAVGSHTEGTWSAESQGSRFLSYLSTGAPNASRALQAVLYELERMSEESILTEELLLEKSRSVGRQAMGYDSYDAQARYLATTAAAGLPLDYDVQRLEGILAVNAEQVMETAERYFSSGWFVSAAGGVDGYLQPLEQNQ